MSQLYARHALFAAAGGLQATGVDNNEFSVLLDPASGGLALAAAGLTNATVIGSTGAGMSLVNGAAAKNAAGTTHQLRSITSAGGTVAITQPNDDELNLELVVNFSRFRGTFDASPNVNPTPATSTNHPGDAIEAGDYYIVTVPGTVGGVATSVNDLVIAEIDNPAADGDWTVVDGQSTSNFVPQTRQLIPSSGIQIDGGNVGVDLTGDRTFTVLAADDSLTVTGAGVAVQPHNGLTLSAGNGLQVVPDAATGGTTIPVAVSANGVGVDTSTIDHANLLNVVANEHIDHSTVRVVNGADTGLVVVNNDLTANIDASVDITGTTVTAGIDDADEVLIHDISAGGLRKVTRADLVGTQGRIQEYITLAATGTMTLAQAPASAAEVQVIVRGGSVLIPVTDFTVAGTAVNFSAPQQARLVVGDQLSVLYQTA